MEGRISTYSQSLGAGSSKVAFQQHEAYTKSATATPDTGESLKFNTYPNEDPLYWPQEIIVRMPDIDSPMCACGGAEETAEHIAMLYPLESSKRHVLMDTRDASNHGTHSLASQCKQNSSLDGSLSGNGFNRFLWRENCYIETNCKMLGGEIQRRGASESDSTGFVAGFWLLPNVLFIKQWRGVIIESEDPKIGPRRGRSLSITRFFFTLYIYHRGTAWPNSLNGVRIYYYYHYYGRPTSDR